MPCSSWRQTLRFQIAQAARFGVGNSTVNAFANSSTLKLANSTVNTYITIPTSVQYSATNYFLHANGSWVEFSGGAGNPGGSNTEIQFNDSGGFGSDALFTYNKTTDTLNAANVVISNTMTVNTVSLTLGNSTVFATLNAISLGFGNSTVNAVANLTTHSIANSTMSTVMTLGTLAMGNSTINAIANSSALVLANSTLTHTLNMSNLQNIKYATITYVIDGGGSTITTGFKGFLEVPFGCTINRVTALADQSGSIVVDIWKDTYANYPALDADSITASAPVTISAATKSQDSTLTGWTTSIAAGDILGFNVDSVTTCQRVTISLRVSKT
jgi:hypothetical protein